MDIQPSDQTGQALSDDQELAKVLAGVNNTDGGDGDASQGAPDPQAGDQAMPQPDGQTTDMSGMTDQTDPGQVLPSDPMNDGMSGQLDDQMAAAMPPMPEAPAMDTMSTAPSGDLQSIKQEALGELRPLVDKLEVSPEEKFDTYLLLLRSTDDRELIAPAHAAAKAIVDESRKAQALLDIIKEIDFLSKPQQ